MSTIKLERDTTPGPFYNMWVAPPGAVVDWPWVFVDADATYYDGLHGVDADGNATLQNPRPGWQFTGVGQVVLANGNPGVKPLPAVVPTPEAPNGNITKEQIKAIMGG